MNTDPMEPATHSLTAYMLSRAGLNRWCPGATPVVVMAANVPDIDFASLLGGDLLTLEWHRGPTHALAFVALMAALPLLPMLIFARKRMVWKKAYAVSVIGVLSHLYLDWTNIFGVRLLEPFSRHYYHLDTTGVTDLWMLAVLLAVAGWFVIAHLVSSEIGARKPTGRGAAIAVLLFVCLWQSGRYFAHERAVAMLDSVMYDGETPRRVAALPSFVSPLRWTGVVETETAYRLFEFSLTEGGFDPLSGERFYKPEPSASIELAKQTEPFQQFLRFADFALWQVLPAAEPEGATEVRVMDIRFGLPGEGRFVSTAVIDRQGQLLRDWFQFDPPGGYPRFR